MRVEHPGGRNQMERRNDPQGVYCVPLPLCLHEYRKKRSSTVGLSNNDVRSEPSITEARNNFVMSSNLKNYFFKISLLHNGTNIQANGTTSKTEKRIKTITEYVSACNEEIYYKGCK